MLIAALAIAVTAGLGWAAFAFGARWMGTASFTDGFPGWGTGRTVGVQDGFVPDGGHLSPHDTELPAIANLDPKLLHAVQEAADDAADDGVDLFLTTGWRSKAYQQRLLDEAVVKYGSEREARRYVGTPEQSHHVTGKAVDIGPTDADSWLSQHGTDYGLCQTYGNEMWHFELATTPGGVCPEMLPDASDGRSAPTE
ncbi:M15 family metallopeptidase [Streptosporangium sp. 'caverna']|uniref:M15 family metallopeptidase n=1 Tax=Streptosporangium sp. 'caverna' TaxID=2202249 RepID=UPI001EF8F7B7|nr:M15 family metallopeptidase [Streptosporangium sp. 'caverna']